MCYPNFDYSYCNHNIIINADCEKVLNYDSAVMIKENIAKALNDNMLSIGNGEWIFSQVSVRESKIDTIFIVEISVNGDIRANIKYVNDGTYFYFMIDYPDTKEYYAYSGGHDSFASATKSDYYNFINDIYATYNAICITGDYHCDC